MILVPNEVAWLAERIGQFNRTVMLETPFGSYSELVIATCLPMLESHYAGGDSGAFGLADPQKPNRDLGVWQISTRWHAAKLQKYRWWDPFDNARLAKLVYDETRKAFPKRLGPASGFTAWTVFNAKDDEDPDADPQWGFGTWHQVIEAAEFAVQYPWEPQNHFTTAWRK